MQTEKTHATSHEGRRKKGKERNAHKKENFKRREFQSVKIDAKI
jgi:hypothetical protein